MEKKIVKIRGGGEGGRDLLSDSNNLKTIIRHCSMPDLLSIDSTVQKKNRKINRFFFYVFI